MARRSEIGWRHRRGVRFSATRFPGNGGVRVPKRGSSSCLLFLSINISRDIAPAPERATSFDLDGPVMWVQVWVQAQLMY